jgi:shikimate dehydrogenase
MSLPAITGATGLYAVVGDPVRQARVPGLLNPLLPGWGVDAVVVPWELPAAAFTEVVTAVRPVANLRGLFITVPHKVAAGRLAVRLSSRAARAGCANVLRPEPGGGWYADNFDGIGFVAGLRAAGFDPGGTRVSLVGAGGAGAAIAVALVDAGVAGLWVYDTDESRCVDLVARLEAAPEAVPGAAPGTAHACGEPRLAGVDLVVNATPLGLRPEDPLPFDPRTLAPGSLVADIIMHPAETALLRTAAGHGCRVQPGEPMLAHQLSFYRQFFGLGVRASEP